MPPRRLWGFADINGPSKLNAWRDHAGQNLFHTLTKRVDPRDALFVSANLFLETPISDPDPAPVEEEADQPGTEQQQGARLGSRSNAAAVANEGAADVVVIETGNMSRELAVAIARIPVGEKEKVSLSHGRGIDDVEGETVRPGARIGQFDVKFAEATSVLVVADSIEAGRIEVIDHRRCDVEIAIEEKLVETEVAAAVEGGAQTGSQVHREVEYVAVVRVDRPGHRGVGHGGEAGIVGVGQVHRKGRGHTYRHKEEEEDAQYRRTEFFDSHNMTSVTACLHPCNTNKPRSFFKAKAMPCLQLAELTLFPRSPLSVRGNCKHSRQTTKRSEEKFIPLNSLKEFSFMKMEPIGKNEWR